MISCDFKYIYKNALDLINHPRRIFLIFLHRTSRLWPDELFLKVKYRLVMGQKLNLKDPKTFNEKLQWLKLYNRKPEYTTMVDKYAVKAYVASKIGKEYIIPTLGIWDKPDEIDWNSLPNQFVLKTTHGGGGGGVVICKEKSSFDIESAKKKLKRSLKSDIYLSYREWPYKDVQKRIIAEQFMTDGGYDEQLRDYKFFCFNGKVRCLKVDFDRFTNHFANYYDRTGALLPFGEASYPPNNNKAFKLPTNFEQMIVLAEKISVNIPFLRVDLYNSNDKIYFGELTFFPAAGMGKFVPEEWDIKLGKWINLIKINS